MIIATIAKQPGVNIDHHIVGKLIIEDLLQADYILFYEDVYDVYSTIDLRKSGGRYNVMLVDKGDRIECHASAYNNFLLEVLNRNSPKRLSSFIEVIKSALSRNRL